MHILAHIFDKILGSRLWGWLHRYYACYRDGCICVYDRQHMPARLLYSSGWLRPFQYLFIHWVFLNYQLALCGYELLIVFTGVLVIEALIGGFFVLITDFRAFIPHKTLFLFGLLTRFLSVYVVAHLLNYLSSLVVLFFPGIAFVSTLLTFHNFLICLHLGASAFYVSKIFFSDLKFKFLSPSALLVCLVIGAFSSSLYFALGSFLLFVLSIWRFIGLRRQKNKMDFERCSELISSYDRAKDMEDSKDNALQILKYYLSRDKGYDFCDQDMPFLSMIAKRFDILHVHYLPELYSLSYRLMGRLVSIFNSKRLYAMGSFAEHIDLLEAFNRKGTYFYDQFSSIFLSMPTQFRLNHPYRSSVSDRLFGDCQFGSKVSKNLRGGRKRPSDEDFGIMLGVLALRSYDLDSLSIQNVLSYAHKVLKKDWRSDVLSSLSRCFSRFSQGVCRISGLRPPKFYTDLWGFSARIVSNFDRSKTILSESVNFEGDPSFTNRGYYSLRGLGQRGILIHFVAEQTMRQPSSTRAILSKMDFSNLDLLVDPIVIASALFLAVEADKFDAIDLEVLNSMMEVITNMGTWENMYLYTRPTSLDKLLHLKMGARVISAYSNRVAGSSNIVSQGQHFIKGYFFANRSASDDLGFRKEALVYVLKVLGMSRHYLLCQWLLRDFSRDQGIINLFKISDREEISACFDAMFTTCRDECAGDWFASRKVALDAASSLDMCPVGSKNICEVLQYLRQQSLAAGRAGFKNAPSFDDFNLGRSFHQYKNAYHKLALWFHPDKIGHRNGGREATHDETRAFQRLQEHLGQMELLLGP